MIAAVRIRAVEHAILTTILSEKLRRPNSLQVDRIEAVKCEDGRSALAYLYDADGDCVVKALAGDFSDVTDADLRDAGGAVTAVLATSLGA